MTSRPGLSIAAVFSPLLLAAVALSPVTANADSTSAPDADVAKRFEFLSQNGNASCSRAFRDSVADMPASSRLQGSCCGEMNLHRYSEQINGLKRYSQIIDIPPDPYDVPAPLAHKLMVAYQEPLSTEQQEQYDLAMETSNEKGPCCCPCWRWEVYGGLGELLIREHGFTGEQVTQVWNLSDGCGDDAHTHH